MHAELLVTCSSATQTCPRPKRLTHRLFLDLWMFHASCAIKIGIGGDDAVQGMEGEVEMQNLLF